MATPTEVLVDHALSTTYADISTDVQDRLKQHLLDTLAVSIGARTAAASTPTFEDAVRRLAGDGDEATALTGERMQAADAALINGSLAHSLDFDDTHRESSSHPGAPVIAAALAVAEREDADAETLLTAVKVGYDVACALGRAINPDAHYDRGFHITATCGTFGATAAAGVVAGLSAEELAAAFGVNGSQTAGSLQFLKNGAWNKRLHPGLAGRRAVEAVTLAQEGFRGSEDPIEGDYGFFAAYTPEAHPEELDDIGERDAVMETALKPYPCCRYMHSAIDGLIDLADEVDAADVTSMTVDLPKSGVTLTGSPIEEKRRPENFVNCQFSMPFAASLAIMAGEAGLSAFLDAQADLDGAERRRLMDATEVVTTEEVGSLFPDQWAARVVVETAEGTHERFVETARGEPEHALGWDGVEAKYRDLTAAADVSEAAADGLLDSVKRLDEDASVADLAAALVDVAADPTPAAAD
jgi:2-methylcitrate dehydratase PrpD